MTDPVSCMCAARCASCYSWLYNQLSSLCGGGSTITIACHDMFNRINCCEKCNCFQSTNITVHGNVESLPGATHVDTIQAVASRALPVITEQPTMLPFIQPKRTVESDI